MFPGIWKYLFERMKSKNSYSMNSFFKFRNISVQIAKKIKIN